MIRLVLATPVTNATGGDFMNYMTYEIADPRLESFLFTADWRIVGAERFTTDQEVSDRKAGRSPFSKGGAS